MPVVYRYFVAIEQLPSTAAKRRSILAMGHPIAMKWRSRCFFAYDSLPIKLCYKRIWWMQYSADLGYGEQGRYFCIWFPPVLHSGDTTFTPFGIAT